MARVDDPAQDEQLAGQPEPQSPTDIAPGHANRRAFPRHAVDCPVTVIPVGGIGQMAGQLSDLSMGGCLVRLEQRYLAGMLVRVEVQFQMRGIAFRILGVTVGTRGARSFAIRFLDVPERRREELAEVLKEIAAVNAIATVKEAREMPIDLNRASHQMLESAMAIEPGEAAGPAAVLEEACAAEAPASPSVFDPREEPGIMPAAAASTTRRSAETAPARERRTHGRHTVDTSVRLLLIKTAIAMTGRIANLSMGGCRIRTDERFSVGIFVRVEAEFYLHGLPFRIAGVSQAIQDRNMIGIRFLDMSERCRAQLVELIAEIEEAHTLEGDEPEQSSSAK